MKTKILAVLCFLTLFTFLNASELEGLKSRIHEFTISNGMKFILIEDHSVPVANFVTYVNIGSSDERIGIYGISHILEHLAFKGTSEVGTKDAAAEKKLFARMDQLFEQICLLERAINPDQEKIKQLKEELARLEDEAEKYVIQNEFSAIISQNGGTGLNAFTSNDATVYFFSLPSNRLELWAYLESSRFTDPVFRQFYKEKNVIMEERRMAVENNPVGKLIEEFLSVAFREQPYAVGVIGPMSNLRFISRQDVYDYFTSNYNAANMIVGVSGDVYPDQLKKIAEKYFGRIKRGKKSLPHFTIDPAPVSKKELIMREDSQPVLVIGFRSPAINEADFLKFSILDNILTDGRVSRLYKKLVIDEKTAMMVGSMAGFPGNKYPGLYLIYAFPNSDHSNQELQEKILQEIKKIKTEGVTQEELESAKIRAKVDYLRGFKENQYLLIDLLSSEFLLGSWQKYFDQYNEIDKISADEIKEIVNRYLDENTMTIGRIEKKEAK